MSENNIMKEKLLLIGAGTFGRAVSEQAILNYDCAFVDDGFSVGDTVCDIPVVGHISDLETLRSNYVLIYSNSVVHTQVHIGRCVRIGGNVTISNGVVVPDGMDVKNGATLY